jgi:hypothetical protein
MKRIVTLTTAALMLAGMTSLSLAHESTTEGTQTPPAVQSQPATGTVKSAVNMGQEKPPVAVNDKSEVQPSKKHHAARRKMAQGSSAVTEKKETPATTTATPEPKEKKAEPQPAATETNPTK